VQALAYALLVAAQSLAAAVAAKPAPATAPEMVRWWGDFAKDQRMVRIGRGRSLLLFCEGKGSPTVLLESGLGDRVTVWRKVQPVLARRYRVCGYNRAGIGGSTVGPMPRDAKAIVSDLETLVRRAQLRPPYILVGHSLGGLTMRLFARRHLRQTAGIVLVDPASTDLFSRFPDVPIAMLDEYRKELSHFRGCAAQVEKPECELSPPDDAPTALRANLTVRQPKDWFATMASELESVGPGGSDQKEVRAAGTKLGSIPMIVLTADWVLREKDIPETQRQRLQSAIIDLHKEFAATSRRGSDKLVAGSSHYIQWDSPRSVIDAVNRVAAMAGQ
jgi:pimeloyl-ACP methyl ester carboxylesterase